ncbi:MAG: ABC-type dipeptide transport system periplasmic component-like protein [Actinomycetia bacterium]|nr:ABC-type dipeptide transport system periplasmic component-like protein [Actinomycetes bacterium]
MKTCGSTGGRRRRTIVTAIALSGTLLAGTAALGTLATPAAATAPGGRTLRVMMSTSGVDTLNPFLAFFNGALDIFGAIYPTLNSLDERGKPGPYLATSWTTSPDQLTWTFKLRDGLRWSDGTPLTAEDAAWTFNLIRTNAVAGTANGSLVRNFDSVTAPDATTLVIKTKKPQANVPYVSIPASGIPIVPKHVWEPHVAGLKDYRNDTFPVVGYGPWTLTGYKPEQYAKLDANKGFVLGAPKYDHLIEQSFKETDAAVAALRSGQLDYISALQPTQFKALRGQKNMRTIKEVGNGWRSLEVNSGAKTRTGRAIGTGNPLLADPVVRKAISLSIDKQTLVTKVLDGMGQIAEGYLPPAWPQWKWTPSPADQQKFDPTAAGKLLDNAGYRKGSDGIRVDAKTGKQLSFRLGTHSDDAKDSQISGYLLGWLKDIGIKVTIQPLSMSALNSDLAKGDWDLLMDSWPTGPDPTYLLGIQTCATLPKDDGTGGNSDAFFCDKNFDSLFDQQLTTFDPARRAQVIGQMQDIFYKANVNDIVMYGDTLDVVRTDTVRAGMIAGNPDATGHYPAQTSFWSYLKATPSTAAKSSSDSTALGAVVGIVVVVLVASGVVTLHRRSTADDRE